MTTVQPDLKLKFPAGRFEGHIVSVILLLQLTCGGLSALMLGFMLLSIDGFAPVTLVFPLMPLVLVILLNLLYE